MADGNCREDSDTTTRRSVLKTAGGIGAGSLVLGSASPGSARHTIATDITFVQIDTMSAHPNPDDKEISIIDYLEARWEDEIEDGSGDYEASITSNYEVIPESELDQTDTLEDRRYSADKWLRENDSNTYDNNDVMVVLDYWGVGGEPYARGRSNTAGDSTNATVIVDCWYEDDGQLPSTYRAVGTEGLAVRPTLKTYGAEHPDDVEVIPTSYYGDVASLMYNGDGHGCDDYTGSVDFIETFLSSCTESAVRKYIEDNL